MGNIGDSKAIRFLVEYLDNEDLVFINHIEDALVKIGDEKAIEAQSEGSSESDEEEDEDENDDDRGSVTVWRLTNKLETM